MVAKGRTFGVRAVKLSPKTWRKLDAWRGPLTRVEALQMLIEHASLHYRPMSIAVDSQGYWKIPDRPTQHN